jgi:hypothetical protein
MATYNGAQSVSSEAAAKDPSKVLADVSKQERLYYDSLFRPVNRELVGDVNSRKLIKTAKNTAGQKFDAGLDRNKRQRARFGFSDTALDSENQLHAAESTRGLNYDNLVNTARNEQYERNTGLRNELINASRGIAKSAVDGLGTAAALQTQRENNNASISAQNDAAKSQVNGQMAGMAMMAISMM